jgi:hypothetical protein
MSQEFESRVNELVVARNLPYNEAAEIVTKELAEEGVEETQKKNDTNSEPSGGSFNAIEQPSFPLTSWQTNTIAEYPEFEEDIINTDYTAVDQAEVDALNTEYQARVDKYSSEFGVEANKLINVLVGTQEEGYGDVYSRFQEETGILLGEDQIEEITALATKTKEENERINTGLNPLFETAVVENNFEPVREYLKSNGVSDDYTQSIEEQWKSKSLDYSLQRGGAEHAASLHQLVYSSEELEQKLTEYEIQNPGSYPEGKIEEIVNEFDQYKRSLSDDFLYEAFESRTELSERVRNLKENGYSAIDPDLSAINEGLAKDVYVSELANIQAELDEVTKREAQMIDLMRTNPLVREALAYITMNSSRYFTSLSEGMRERVTNKELNMYEAAWEESEEYKRATEMLDEDVLDKYGTPQLNQEELREERFEEQKAEFIRAEKEKVTNENRKNLRALTAETEDKDEVQALERAIYEISGSAIDIEGEGGYIGDTRVIDAFGGMGWFTYAAKQVSNYIAAGTAELPAMAFRGTQYARGSFDETVAMNGAQIMLDNGLLTQKEYEERIELIERRRDVRDDFIETYLNPDFLEGVAEKSIAMEDGIMDSFREGNYGAGVLQSLEMASQALPLTLATMAISTLSSPAAGLAFASSIAAGMEYEAVRKEDWYNNMSDAKKAMYITGIGLIEGGSEVIGGFTTGKLVKGVGKRLINESRDAYLKRFTRNTIVNYSSDALTEMSVEYGGAGLRLGLGEVEIDWRNTNDSAIESGIVSFFMSGGVQLGGATINTGGSVARGSLQRFDAGQSFLSSFDSAFNANMNPDQLIFEKDLQNRVTNILQTTKPGSQVRAQMLDQLMEDSSVGAQIKMDSFEFNEYLRQADPAAAQQISQNTIKLSRLMKALQSSTDANQIKQMRSEISSLVAENQSIEGSAMAGFSVNSADVANASIDKLQNRARLFLRQATRLENQGKIDGAKSLRQRAKRIQSQVETITLNRDVTKGLEDGTVISSKDRNAAELSNKLSAMNVDRVVVDEALAEEMKKKGYAEVLFKGNSGGALMVKGAENLDLNTANLSREAAMREVNIALKEQEGSLTNEDIENEIFDRRIKGDASSPLLDRLSERLSEENNNRINARVETVKARKETDIVNKDGKIATTPKREELELSGENQKLKERLTRVSGLQKGKVRVVSETEAFRVKYAQAPTPAAKREVLQGYMDGTETVGGYYNQRTGEVVLTSNATQKDIVEEFAHAAIHQQMMGIDRASRDFRVGLQRVMAADPQIAREVAAKMEHYSQTTNMTQEMLAEEALVEVFASYVANEMLVEEKTKSWIQEQIEKRVPQFAKNGGRAGVVMRKLSETLRNDIFDEKTAIESWNDIFSQEQKDQESKDESSESDNTSSNFSSKRRGPTFLDNKTVTYSVFEPSRFTAEDKYVGTRTKTFKDYYHFVNWYRKMTGNGRSTNVGMLSYVNDKGETKKLFAPKPLVDKATGRNVWMDVGMKSFASRQIERNRRNIQERQDRHRMESHAYQSYALVTEQVHDIISESMARGEGFSFWGKGNTTQFLQEMMDDFVPGGVLVEGEMDGMGKPVREKILGSPEFKEELLTRVNEYLSDNFPGEVVLFSGSSRKVTVTRLIDASAGITSKQKRKNLDKLISMLPASLNSPIVKELQIYVASLNDKQLGGSVPRTLVNAALNALDVANFSKTHDGQRTPATRQQLLVMYAEKLIAYNNLYDNDARDFFKNAQKTIDDIIEDAGKRIIAAEGGVIREPDEKIAELAKKHENLLKVIIAVTSNGSKAQINLQEATVVYNVVINELQSSLEDLQKNSPEVYSDPVELKKWMSSWGGGESTLARLELIEYSDRFKNIRFTPGRGDKIADALRAMMKMYDFGNPSLIKRRLGKKVDNNKKIQVAAQRSVKDGGFGPKIGAFAMNLLGNMDVITQDLHVIESLDRTFRPNANPSVDIRALHELMKGEMGLSEEEISKIEEEQGWVMFTEENADGSAEKVYDVKKVIFWLKNEGAGKINGCVKGENKRIRRFIENNFVPRTRLAASSKARAENNQLINDLHALIKENYPGYKRISKADVGQMIFLENHASMNAFGAASRIYEDYYGDAADKALEQWEDNLITQNSSLTYTSKKKLLSEIDPLDVVDLDLINELTNLSEQGQISEADAKRLKDIVTFREEMPNLVDQLERILMTDLNPGLPTFFSSKKRSKASDHPQSNLYDVASVFSGEVVSSMSNFRMGKVKMDLNKLLEGRATEIDMKAKINSFGKMEEGEFVNGVMFIRNPLHSEGFVDSYGNILKSAERAFMSGDVIIASGEIKMDQPSSRALSDNIDVLAPEHLVAFENFKEIVKQRNPSLRDLSSDFFEMSYRSLSAKDRKRFAKLTTDEHGNVIKGRRLRGTSKRLASSSEFGRFKNEIISNPENYIDKQSIAAEKKSLEDLSAQELVSLMRGDALDNLATRNDDVGVLAGIELINRMQATGNDIGISSVLDRLAAVGTTAGRILRHMAELKTSTPQGMANVIINKAEAQGKILSEAQKEEILKATSEYMGLYREAQALMERGIAGEDVEAVYKEKLNELNSSQTKLDALANKYVEKSWSEIGVQLVQGNLLTMMSQARNVVYNLANIIPKTVIDVMSFPVSKAFEAFGLHKEKRKLSLAAYLYAMRKFGAGAVEAMEQVITGREKDMSEWRMSRGFMPIRSLMNFMSTDLAEAKTLRGEINQRAKLLVQATLGIPAETMFRLLSLGDVPFRRYAEGLELYYLGKGKGLEGDALAQFLKFPDVDSAEQSETEGRKLTFQEPMGLAKGSMWIIDNMAKGMGKAFDNVKGFDAEGFFKFLIRLNVPYVSTIANFTEETLTYASPIFGGAKMAAQMSNKEYAEASKTLSKVAVGQVVSSTALYLISQGILSGSVDWEDDEKTNLMYDTFPPNSINTSALRRLLAGGDPAPQPGDEFVSYQTLGVFGTIMGSYAHSTTPDAAKEMMDQPFGGNQVLKRLFGFDNVSVAAYMMDQSFLQGLNGITGVLASTSNPDDLEREFFRYVETISKAFSAMFLPNVLSGIDQATREFMPDKRDLDLADRIKNHVRERTFNTGGLPVKVNWKGERIDQAPVGGNQFSYYMFDALKNRKASQDEVSIEILNLYLETGVLTRAVGTPYYASSVYRKIKTPSLGRGKARKAYEKSGKTYSWWSKPQEDFEVKLTAKEINEALAISNTMRYEDIKSFMLTEDYKSMSSNEKIEALDEINDRYKSLLSYNPDGSFMLHSLYIMDIMEQKYLEQYGQD